MRTVWTGRLACFGDDLARTTFKFLHVTRAAGRRGLMLFGHMTPRKFANVLSASADFFLSRQVPHGLPPLVAIDVSPRCNLHCTVCVHAWPGQTPHLRPQHFRPDMAVEDYRRVIAQLAGRCLGVQLYYLGDPIVHPELPQLCRIAAEAGLYVQFSTNLSVPLSEERLEALVTSGLSTLTLCIDGMTQEVYGRTRVGGNIALVIENLRRLCAIRRRLHQRRPRIEVQFIRFRHNQHEIEAAQRLCRELGVDQFASFWGVLSNYSDQDDYRRFQVYGPRPKRPVPNCHMPYLTAVIKSNGDVLPCGIFRRCEQYAEGGDARPLGNLLQTPLEELWRSEPYRRLRRLVRDPSLADRDTDYQACFCHSCPIIYRTSAPEALRRGSDYDWEDLYELNADGLPVLKGPR